MKGRPGSSTDDQAGKGIGRRSTRCAPAPFDYCREFPGMAFGVECVLFRVRRNEQEWCRSEQSRNHLVILHLILSRFVYGIDLRGIAVSELPFSTATKNRVKSVFNGTPRACIAMHRRKNRRSDNGFRHYSNLPCLSRPSWTVYKDGHGSADTQHADDCVHWGRILREIPVNSNSKQTPTASSGVSFFGLILWADMITSDCA